MSKENIPKQKSPLVVKKLPGLVPKQEDAERNYVQESIYIC